jgi:co-chaperonin GroES (HSP10)
MRHALNFYLVVREIKKTNHTVAAGLQLSEEFDQELRYLDGEVVSVGSRIVKEMADEPIKIEPGDVVQYDRHAGHEIRWTDDEPLKVLKLGDLASVDK